MQQTKVKVCYVETVTRITTAIAIPGGPSPYPGDITSDGVQMMMSP